VVDLGQVLFVFFVLVPFVQRIDAGPVPFQRTLVNFLRTPVILSILLGIVANRTGLMVWAEGNPLSAALIDTLQMLGAATTPLIGIVIGYELNLRRQNLGAPLRTIGLRLLFWVPVGLLINMLVVERLFPGTPALQAAVMTMFVLPPPFVIPIFVRRASAEDNEYVVNTLSLATVVTLIAFTVVSVIYAV
jgi:predicted permease